jgi:hypothetical protein
VLVDGCQHGFSMLANGELCRPGFIPPGRVAGTGGISLLPSARASKQTWRPRPIPPARAARPQKIKGISIFVDCWYSG